jgi:hypothetical protein
MSGTSMAAGSPGPRALEMHQLDDTRRNAPVMVTSDEIDLRYGDRIEVMLAHWLDDEGLAKRLRRPIVAALVARLETLPPGYVDLEDWVFGEARREAREIVPPERIPGVIPAMRSSFEEQDEQNDDEWDPEPSRWRISVPARWIWFGTFMALMLGAIAFASLDLPPRYADQLASVRQTPVTDLASALPARESNPTPVRLPALDAELDSAPLPPPQLPVVLDALQAPAPPPLDPGRIAALVAAQPDPVPAQDAEPVDKVEPAAAPPADLEMDWPAEPTSAARVPSVPRVYIHYSTVDRVSGERAARLAALLRENGYPVVAIRKVPFQIGQPSVRYFFEENHAAADQLIRLSGMVLPPDLRGTYGAPADFTHFTPRPQPGTLEIWLPTG